MQPQQQASWAGPRGCGSVNGAVGFPTPCAERLGISFRLSCLLPASSHVPLTVAADSPLRESWSQRPHPRARFPFAFPLLLSPTHPSTSPVPGCPQAPFGSNSTS